MWLLTIDEYIAASAWTKFVYRMYRNPFMMLVVGPIYIFLVAYRFNRKDARKKKELALT